MSTNKHASIRYRALDKCFANRGRKFFMEDLIDACNKALNDFTGKPTKIQRRQIFDDIKYMESTEGYSIPLDRIKDNRKNYYRYSDPKFSIDKKKLTDKEEKQLKEALSTLSRLKGMPQFEWMEEIIARLDSELGLSGTSVSIIDFEQNKYLKGLEYISPIYEAILNQQCITIEYLSFKINIPQSFVIHPYFLKQYNNRWFCFGLNNNSERVINLALDRIKAISPNKTTYVPNETIDFNEYFEDTVGVTVFETEAQEIKILVDKDLLPYIETKPLHGSMKIKERNESNALISLKLIPNYELESLLLSFGEKIQILEPTALRKKIGERVKNLAKLYKKI